MGAPTKRPLSATVRSRRARSSSCTAIGGRPQNAANHADAPHCSTTRRWSVGQSLLATTEGRHHPWVVHLALMACRTQRTTFLCGRRISRNCGYQRPGQQPICARRRQPAAAETLVFTRPPGLAAAGKFFAPIEGSMLSCRAAYAARAGAAPIPASSGKTIRYRLDRSGDRKLNRALHMIRVTRKRVRAAPPEWCRWHR
jgi:hypothetical protein